MACCSCSLSNESSVDGKMWGRKSFGRPCSTSNSIRLISAHQHPQRRHSPFSSPIISCLAICNLHAHRVLDPSKCHFHTFLQELCSRLSATRLELLDQQVRVSDSLADNYDGNQRIKNLLEKGNLSRGSCTRVRRSDWSVRGESRHGFPR